MYVYIIIAKVINMIQLTNISLECFLVIFYE
jgi:hypothetical protein